MPVFTETDDPVVKRQVRRFDYRGRTYRLPSLLAERFEPTEILACGGFGVLLVACDRRVFQRRVLIKAGLLEPRLLSVPNNVALPSSLKENRLRVEHERKMLLHGQYRGASGIPVLIDWFDDVNPLVRGSHRDVDGRTFTNDEAGRIKTFVYDLAFIFRALHQHGFVLRQLPLTSLRWLHSSRKYSSTWPWH